MKKAITIIGLRKVATIAVLIIASVFFGFSGYFWFSYGNALKGDVEVGTETQLLTRFDTSKFDDAVKRLEKRRNLKDSAADIHDPFGVIPQ